MNDHLDDNLENELRDVLAHQARSVDGAADTSPRPVDLAEPVSMSKRRRRSRAVWGGTAGIIATAAAVALVTMSVGPRAPEKSPGEELSAALSQTAESGSFAVTYDIAVTAPTSPAPSTTIAEVCTTYDPDVTFDYDSLEPGSTGVLGPDGDPAFGGADPEAPAPVPVMPDPDVSEDGDYASACYSPAPPVLGQHITGEAAVHVDPYAVNSASSGESFGDITVRADDENVWLTLGVGGSPMAYPLMSFAQSQVVPILGPRQGPVVMMALSSPGGYLTLTEEQTKGAVALNETEIDGIPVSEYEIELAPDEMDDVTGMSGAQAEVIEWAITTLAEQGYTGTTMRIAVGDDGYIHWLLSTANFADGSTAAIDAQFSNFGCAPPVTLPSGVTAGADQECEQSTATTSTTSTTSTTVPTSPRALAWSTEHHALWAEDFVLEIGDRVVTNGPGITTTSTVAVDFGTLTVIWDGQDLSMSFGFATDGTDWWVERIYAVSSGNVVAEFDGEFFRSPVGVGWVGSFDQTVGDAHIRFDDMSVQGFLQPGVGESTEAPDPVVPIEDLDAP